MKNPKRVATTKKTAIKRKTALLAPEPKRIVRWKDIARAAFMLGVVSDFSKGEMLRLHGKLKASKDVEHLARGQYRIRKRAALKALGLR
jgi:hypothetical protein